MKLFKNYTKVISFCSPATSAALLMFRVGCIYIKTFIHVPDGSSISPVSKTT